MRLKMIVRNDPPAAGTGAWTPDAMLERLDGDEVLAQQLAALFVAEYQRMLDDVRSSVESGSGERIRRAAHALKGSVSNFTAGAPVTTAQALETAGRDNRLDAAPALLEQLGRELESLVGHLSTFARR